MEQHDELEARYGDLAVRAKGHLVVTLVIGVALGGVMLYLYQASRDRLAQYQQTLERSADAQMGLLNVLLRNQGMMLATEMELTRDLARGLAELNRRVELVLYRADLREVPRRPASEDAQPEAP